MAGKEDVVAESETSGLATNAGLATSLLQLLPLFSVAGVVAESETLATNAGLLASLLSLLPLFFVADEDVFAESETLAGNAGPGLLASLLSLRPVPVALLARTFFDCSLGFSFPFPLD